jgi:abortive infection bacteriophage resistance protein
VGIPYEKPHVTYEEQIDKLIERGLEVSDRDAAAATLRLIGYYRLSAYLHTFRPPKPDGASGHDERLNSYLPGSSYEQAVELLMFDRALRLVLLDGLEQFEIALRTSVAYNAGTLDPFVHLRPDLLTDEFTNRPISEGLEYPSAYDRWMVKYLERLESSKNEAFVKWFAHKYDDRLPIWVAVEIFEFGQTSRLIQGLPLGQRRQIAEDFGFLTQKDFGSWIASLNGIRNFCAHHSRLWNRSLVTIAARPKSGDIPELDHLRGLDDVSRVKIYAPIAVLVWVLSRNESGQAWKIRLRTVLDSFPSLPSGSLANAGFPANWGELPLWN